MSVWDYVLPWKAVPNMVKDVKAAGGGSKDGKNGRERSHGSVVGAIGKYADPAGALLGDRWMEFWHERLPTKMNEYASGIAQKDPFIQADRKYGLGQEGSPLRGVSNFAEDRPADVTALTLGAIFGGGALLGGMGGSGAGGGAAGGTSGLSPYGPYASGYQLPASSSYSAYGPYASGYQFPSAATQGASSSGGLFGTNVTMGDVNQYSQMAQQMGGQMQQQTDAQNQAAPAPQQLGSPMEALERQKELRRMQDMMLSLGLVENV